jgi:hypothetical protein
MTEKANEEMKKKQEKPKKQIEDNVVFVGKKPTMSYVLAVITQFSEGAKEVHIKARGRSISRAIDVKTQSEFSWSDLKAKFSY